nr:Tyr p 24 allergen [Tyrophagus putrescentiae]
MVQLTRVLGFWNNIRFKKIYFGLQGYNKWGLYNDDLHDYYDNVNLEAIRRLPPDEYDQYVYRVIRASQLEMTKSYIPPSERATYEEDQTKGAYLQPYIKEVLKEKKEKEEWLNFLSKD